MTAVPDASALNYLLRLRLEWLFPKLYDVVLAPLPVLQELAHPATPELVRSAVANPPPWLGSVPSGDVPGPGFPSFLGAGERAVIAVALQTPPPVVAILDDLPARRFALAKGVAVTGTVGVLVLAANRGLVHLASTLDDLESIGFYLRDDLRQQALKLDRS